MLLALLLAVALQDDPAYQDGVRLYEQVDMDGAIARFQDALPRGTPPEQATVHAWIALCHGQLGRTEEAAAAFRAAVRLDPAVRLPALAPTEVEAQLEAARAEAQPTAPAAAPDPPVAPVAPVEPAPPPVVDEGPPALALVAGGTGVALLLAGGATFAVGLDTAFRQAPAAAFNDEARALVDTAYLEYAVAGGLAALGAVGMGAAVVLALE